MASACRSCSLSAAVSLQAGGQQSADCPIWGSSAPGRGQKHFHRPALLLILGNCCRKFPVTAGLNLTKESAPVYFLGISKGLSESSRPVNLYALSYPSVLRCCSLHTQFLFCPSQHANRKGDLSMKTQTSFKAVVSPEDMLLILNHRNIVSLFHCWVFLL